MTDPQHVAYLLANKALRSAKSEVAREFLGEVDSYDAGDPDDITLVVMIIDQAFSLCHQADKIIRQMQNSHTHERAIDELKRRCPGYSDDTYQQAISEAFIHASR